ncbi:SRPBCC family protein [Portibacter marinus]|uniref:SRPBCC family protein n=1 Tax=Portibacter marinus TaxID=2898660 RepID=UPI001F41E959|nr:SRPBCC domain-containing protein [Portibacter marinus]
MIDSNEYMNRTVQIKRILNAPISLVWEAWSEPEHIVHWWNPKGSDTQIEKHDFKVGGEWKYTMLMPNGKPFIAEGRYVEIIYHEKICSVADFKPMTSNVEIQALFKSLGDQTEFTFNVIHPTVEYKIQQEKMGIQNGWGSVFNRLEEYLKLTID